MNALLPISIDLKLILIILIMFLCSYLINIPIFKFYKKINYILPKKYINYSNLICGILFSLFYIKYNLSYEFYMYSLLSCVLVSISFIDLKYMEIPDESNVTILLLGLIQIILNYNNPIQHFLGFLIAGGIFLFIAVITNGSIGGGDIKLIACIGLLLGIKASLIITFCSSILSLIGLIYALLINKQSLNSFIPYGPFIALSTFYFLLI